MYNFSIKRYDGGMISCDTIDWNSWTPDERAVIVYITDRKRGKVLLINKKRGLGKGKVSAPGGRLEKGETYLEAVIRECEEEVSITPESLQKRVELHFQFTSGFSMYGEAFFTDSWKGSPIESDEADPFWCDLDKLPFDKMWADDRYWLSQAIAGQKFRGFFVFDDDTLVSQKLITIDNFSA